MINTCGTRPCQTRSPTNLALPAGGASNLGSQAVPNWQRRPVRSQQPQRAVRTISAAVSPLTIAVALQTAVRPLTAIGNCGTTPTGGTFVRLLLTVASGMFLRRFARCTQYTVRVLRPLEFVRISHSRLLCNVKLNYLSLISDRLVTCTARSISAGYLRQSTRSARSEETSCPFSIRRRGVLAPY